MYLNYFIVIYRFYLIEKENHIILLNKNISILISQRSKIKLLQEDLVIQIIILFKLLKSYIFVVFGMYTD